MNNLSIIQEAWLANGLVKHEPIDVAHIVCLYDGHRFIDVWNFETGYCVVYPSINGIEGLDFDSFASAMDYVARLLS